jgi:V/A-type H+/Na+-transporting ATPase subunit E
MTTLNRSPERDLCEEIIVEAERKAEEIIQSARQQSEILLANTKGEAGRVKQERLNTARTKGNDRRERLLATIPVEKRRLRAAKIESVLQSIYSKARERLEVRDDFNYPETLVALTTEAMHGMTSKAFILKLSPADYRELGERLVREIAERIGDFSTTSIQLESDPAITEGGLIIQDSEGHQTWDNRLSMRLERMWPELRRQLALNISVLSGNSSTGGNP